MAFDPYYGATPAPGGGVAPRRPDTRPRPGTPEGESTTYGSNPIDSTGGLYGGSGGAASPGTTPTNQNNPYYEGQGYGEPILPTDPLSEQIRKHLANMMRSPVGTGPTPKETAFQDAQSQVERLSGLRDAYNDFARTDNINPLKAKLIEMGLWRGAHPGLSEEDSLKRSADDALMNLPQLERNISKTGQDILAERAAGAEVREGQLKQGLGTTGDLIGQLIEQKLREKIGDIGLQGQQVRSDLGAQLANRGLNQSSFGAQRVAQSYLAEQADVASARGAAAKTKGNVGSAIDNVTRQIETRRQDISNKKILSQATTAADVAFDIDTNALNDKFKSEIAQLELDAKSSGFLGSFLGGLAGAVGGFFAGGPVGAAIGYSAGSKAGGAL